MLELAGLGLGRLLGCRQEVVEQPLGQAMPADDIPRAPLAHLGQGDALAGDREEPLRLEGGQIAIPRSGRVA